MDRLPRRIAPLVLALVLPGARASAERCAELGLRLERADGAASREAELGGELLLELGWKGRLVLVERGPASAPLAARLGDLEPGRGGPLRLWTQDRADLAAGRLRLEALAAGTQTLAFTLEDSGGVFSGLPPECRSGVVTVTVVDPSLDPAALPPALPVPAPPPSALLPPPLGTPPETSDRRRAAQDLAGLLYRALLRRALAGRVDPAHVEAIASRGLDGAEGVAAALLGSRELRRHGVRRALAARPGVGVVRREDEEGARRLLLDQVEGDLFGPTRRLDRSARRAAEAHLAACLERPRGPAPADCAELGRLLLRSPAFSLANDLLLSRLAAP